MKREIDVMTGTVRERAFTAEEQAAIAVAAACDAPDYKQLRAQAYPAIGDQLDAVMKWLLMQETLLLNESLQAIAVQCAEVKLRFPKPSAQ